MAQDCSRAKCAYPARDSFSIFVLRILLLDFPIGEIDDRTDDVADDVASLPYADFTMGPFGGSGRNNFGDRLSEARYEDRLIGPPNAIEDRQAGGLKLGDGNLFHSVIAAETLA